MRKVVAVERNLRDLARQLAGRGYTVVDEHYNGYVDAILYDGEKSRLSYLNQFDNVIDMEKGAVLINTANRGLEEIIYAIENKVYESLF